jgi:WD40 repeat protein
MPLLKKIMLFCFVLVVIQSIKALIVQPTANEQPDGNPLRLTEEQSNSFELFARLKKECVDIDDKIISIQCTQKSFRTLLALLEKTHQEQQPELLNLPDTQIIDMIKGADYLMLKRNDVKAVLLHNFIHIAPTIPWHDYTTHLLSFYNLFRHCKQSSEVLEYASKHYLKPLCTHTFENHTGSIRTADWSPDGTKIAVGSQGALHVWDMHTERCMRTFVTPVHSDAIWSIRWSPDNKQLAAGSDGTLYIWDVETGKHVHTFTTPQDAIYSIDWSPNCTHIASGSYGKIFLWNMVKDRCLSKTLTGHTYWVKEVRWSPDGTKIASASGNTIHVWDAETGARLHVLNDSTKYIDTLNWSPEQNTLTSTSCDGTRHTWNIDTGNCMHTSHNHYAHLHSPQWSPCHQELALTSYDHKVCVWDFPKLDVYQLLFLLRAREGTEHTLTTQNDTPTTLCYKSLPKHIQNQLTQSH